MNKIFPTRIFFVCASAALLTVSPAYGQALEKPSPPKITHRSAGAIVTPEGVRTWNSEDPTHTEEMLNQVDEATRAAMENADAASRKAAEQALQQLHKSMNKPGMPPRGLPGLTTVLHDLAQAPALVLTSPMEKKLRDQLQEDLRVMDQLLRDEFKRQDADSSRHVLGIKLLMSDRTQPSPMYVEGYGVIFNYQVNFPLAGAEQVAAKPEEEPAGSAWDRAKREVQTSSRREGQNAYVVGGFGAGGRGYGMSTGGGHGGGFGGELDLRPGAAANQPYNPDRVEALVDAMINSLGEAKNIRNLKSSDAVTVTVAGTDDAGTPARLTLKALKADIDKLAEGKMNPDEFRKKIVRNAG